MKADVLVELLKLLAVPFCKAYMIEKLVEVERKE
jgi:hypothetical protein